MKKQTAALICAIGFALSAAPAMAGPHASEPPTPGEPNCVGQTTAYLAQAFKEEFGEPGLGNVADFAGLSVKEVRTAVQEYCAASDSS